MEHITIQYGKPVNELRMKEEDFWELKAFLAGMGVQIRMCMSYNGECLVQGQNLKSKNTSVWNN